MENQTSDVHIQSITDKIKYYIKTITLLKCVRLLISLTLLKEGIKTVQILDFKFLPDKSFRVP